MCRKKLILHRINKIEYGRLFLHQRKKELFTLPAFNAIRRRQYFLEDCQKLKKHLIKAAQCNGLQRNNFGMNPVIRDLQTAVIVAEEIGMKGSCLIGIMLHEIVKAHILSIEDVNIEYGEDVGSIIKGLVKTNELYSRVRLSNRRISATFSCHLPKICV